VISDDMIDKYIDVLFGHSKPGAMLHNFLIVSVDREQPTDALGLIPTDALKSALYAIDSVGETPPEALIAQTMTAAVVQRIENRELPVFAGLAIETHAVLKGPRDQAAEQLARQLHGQRRLHEHPDVVEVTMLYAACIDGRRWTGEHILTGPRAGEAPYVTTEVGPLSPYERGQLSYMVRMIVGLGSTS
jgi:hypothetical protein